MISKNSLDAKILQYLLANHPVTTTGLQKALNLKENTLYIRLKNLQDRGFILLEPAGPDIYITLLRRDFGFFEKKRQHRAIAKKKPKTIKKDFDSRIYG